MYYNCTGCGKEMIELEKCDGCGDYFCHSCITQSNKDLHPNFSAAIKRSPLLCNTCWDKKN